jgi:hypothetical protein
MTAGTRLVVGLVSDPIYPNFCGGEELRYHELAARLGRRADVHFFTMKMKWWEGSSTCPKGASLSTRRHGSPPPIV